MPIQGDACPAKPNIYKLCRELKKEEHSLFNCLSSIVDDAAFCSEIRVLYPDLPLLANLRCGLWYAPRPDGTCYFKSTDGHQGHHQFSTTRLNWHVAETAARNNGVIIVDATRKGKRAPDAMSKTIPIWAAVINRAVARVRLHDAQKEQRRLFYSSQDGEVLTAVADTQTSISVRSEEPSSVNSSLAATAEGKLADAATTTSSSSGGHDCHHLQQQQQTLEFQQEPQQQRQASPPCGSSLQVEDLLVNCMGDRCMELLSGVSADELRPNTPDQVHFQQPHSSPQGSGSTAAAAAAACAASASLLRPYSYAGSSPMGRTSSLQRSMSLQISPQPSLQEWLDEADVLHRLSAALHYHDCRSPVRRARMSCHSIAGGGSNNFSGTAASVVAEQPVMYASSAPATSCLLGRSPPKCMRALYQDTLTAVQDVQRVRQQLQQEDVQEMAWPATDAAAAAAVVPVTPRRQSEPDGFTLTGSGAADPVTPRIGCYGSLSAAFSSIEEALQDEQPAAAAAAAQDSGLTPQLLQLLEQQHQLRWGLPTATTGPPTVGSAVSVTAGDSGCGAAADPAGDFAFPPPHLLAQSAGSAGLADATVGSTIDAEGPGSTSSSCGAAGLAVPEMPVVVLNGTSHQPGDAVSILHIWRSTDLEDVATLPGISDFKPGVFHVPEQLQAGNEECIECDTERAQQQEGGSGCNATLCQDACSDGWVLVNGQQHRTAVAAAAAAAASIPASSGASSAWTDEETGVGYDGLCAFAPPPVATSVGAADDAVSSTCSVGSAGCMRPSSPSASSSCSAESALSNMSGNSKRSAATAAGGGCAAVEQPWDTELHLPLWVPSNERQAIEAKLDTWVERLLEVGADVRGLAAQLKKPLRPLWVTQDSLIWTNQVAHPSTLSFTPLLLVSASQARQCERQAARAFASLTTMGRTASGSLMDLDDLLDDADDGLPGSGGSKATMKLAKSPSKSNGGGAMPRQHSQDLQQAQQMSSWSYVYVPGAGDDEESWAAGLTPSLFWDNCAALLSCGPAGIAAAVKQLLAQQRNVAYTGSMSAGSSRGMLGGQQQLRGGSSLQASLCGPQAQHCSMPADKHHPAPKGCGGLAGEAAAMGFKVVRAAPGMYWLGNTGIALGNLQGASAADVWRTVDAVLCCGTGLSPALQQEYQAMQVARTNTPALPGRKLHGGAALCGSVPTGHHSVLAAAAAVQQSSAPGPAAGLCFKPTYSWHGSSHTLAPVSSSYSGSCGEWASQQQQQQQGPEPASVSSASARESRDSLQICKQDVSVRPVQPVKRRGGMLSELLSKCKQHTQHRPAAAAAATRHTHAGSGDSTSSCSSSASEISVSLCDSNCSSSYYSTCSDEVAAAHAALPRLKWLPVECAKKDRASLKQQLQEALEFVSAHLAVGHLVLLHDAEGHDNCVSVAVAALLACFTAPEPASAGGQPSAAAAACEPRFVAAWPVEAKDLVAVQQQQQQQADLPPEPVSKQSVRQRLALVSSCYPAARPTRGSLKQVYNFFEERRRSTAGVARHF